MILSSRNSNLTVSFKTLQKQLKIKGLEHWWWSCSFLVKLFFFMTIATLIQLVSHRSCCENSSGKRHTICLTVLTWHSVTYLFGPLKQEKGSQSFAKDDEVQDTVSNYLKQSGHNFYMHEIKKFISQWYDKYTDKLFGIIDRYINMPTFSLSKFFPLWMCLCLINGSIT